MFPNAKGREFTFLKIICDLKKLFYVQVIWKYYLQRA